MRLNWKNLSLGSSLCWHPGVVAANTSSTDTLQYQVPPTIITATRYQQPLQHTAENVSIITQEELARLPAHNLLEGLNFIPGLVVQKNGGVGTREQISIQGAEARQVTVLFDGLSLNNISEGDADLAPLPLEQVGRVEILKGPASSAWGSALGGVIQVLSPDLDPGQPAQIRTGASYGRWGTHQEQLSLLGGGKALGYLLAASHLSTEGFRPKSAHDGYQLFGKVETPWNQGHLGTSCGNLDGDTEDFVQFGPPLWKRHEYTTRYAQLYYRGPLYREWGTQFQVFGIGRDLKVQFLSLEDDQVAQQGDFTEPAWGSMWQVTGPSTAYGRGSGGVDLRVSQADFSFEGGLAKKRFFEQGTYANWSWSWARLALNAGLRYDHHSLYGAQWSPAVGLVYHLGLGKTLIRAQWGRGFGAPPLAAAFLQETDQSAPNPDLRAERATTYHVGIESQVGSPLWVRLTWFNNEIEEAIDSALNGKGKFIQKNFARQQRQGVEIEGRLALPWGFYTTGGVTFNEVKSKDKDEIINGTARQTRDLVVQYHHQRTEFRLAGHYIDYNIASVLKQPPLNFTVRDGRFIWDFKLMQQLPQCLGTVPSLYLAGYNLLNTEFWWITPYPLPGRSIELGIRLAYKAGA